MKLFICLLLGLYSATLVLALNPKVSNEYYNYYIAKKTDFTKVDQDKLVSIKLGEVIPATTNQIFFDRWIQYQPDARLSKGNNPALIFILKQSDIENCKCTLDLKLKPLWQQVIQISINESPVFDQMINESDTIQIQLDRTMLKVGLNLITFNLSGAKKIHFSDKYKSSLEFNSLNLN